MARAAKFSVASASLLVSLLLLLSDAEPPSCNLVITQLGPCLPYVLKSIPKPGDACCNGIQFLGSRYAEDREARQAICKCVQTTIPSVLPVDFELVNNLPVTCGVDVHLPPISFTINCSAI